MKYAIIGAGGTGGTLGFYLTKAGKDVTLHRAEANILRRCRKKGLTMEQPVGSEKKRRFRSKHAGWKNTERQPDVILVCVKGYSMTNLFRMIRKTCRKGDSSPSNPEYLWNRRQTYRKNFRN